MSSKSLVSTKKEEGLTLEQVDLIKATIAKDATDDELKLFLYQAKRTGLDPLSRQLHFVKRNQKRLVNGQWVDVKVATIQTGIDGYRTIAARTGEYAGSDDAEYTEVQASKYPKVAKVTVYRIVQGQKVGFSASARWDEYAQSYNGKLGNMWEKMPYLMLAKCAEALALRKAFPQELSGIYTSEEMGQADNDTTPAVVPTATAKPEEPQQIYNNSACKFCSSLGKFHKNTCPNHPANKAEAKEQAIEAEAATIENEPAAEPIPANKEEKVEEDLPI